MRVSLRRSRLFAQHPVVGAALAAVPLDRFTDAVRDVAMAAARSCGVVDLCAGATDLAQLVVELDDAAWDAKRAEESSDESDASYDELFRQARAADAWQLSADVSSMDTASESVYEALHALGGDASAEARIVELLRA